MSLTLYFHPLSSFCHKVLVALYENSTPFIPHVVHLQEEAARAEFLKVWPIGKFPVLRDSNRGEIIPESTIIIEYLARHHPGPIALLPADPEVARRTRLLDRFLDLYLQLPMQKVMSDRLRPADKRDPFGVNQARDSLKVAYGVLDGELARGPWAVGEPFTMADCAAVPALFYGSRVVPIEAFPNIQRYYDRLMQRPSVARVIEEARPYFSMIPQETS